MVPPLVATFEVILEPAMDVSIPQTVEIGYGSGPKREVARFELRGRTIYEASSHFRLEYTKDGKKTFSYNDLDRRGAFGFPISGATKAASYFSSKANLPPGHHWATFTYSLDGGTATQEAVETAVREHFELLGVHLTRSGHDGLLHVTVDSTVGPELPTDSPKFARVAYQPENEVSQRFVQAIQTIFADVPARTYTEVGPLVDLTNDVSEPDDVVILPTSQRVEQASVDKPNTKRKRASNALTLAPPKTPKHGRAPASTIKRRRPQRTGLYKVMGFPEGSKVSVRKPASSKTLLSNVRWLTPSDLDSSDNDIVEIVPDDQPRFDAEPGYERGTTSLQITPRSLTICEPVYENGGLSGCACRSVIPLDLLFVAGRTRLTSHRIQLPVITCASMECRKAYHPFYEKMTLHAGKFWLCASCTASKAAAKDIQNGVDVVLQKGKSTDTMM